MVSGTYWRKNSRCADRGKERSGEGGVILGKLHEERCVRIQRDIEEAICTNPGGTPVEAGVRKIRVARPGRGKSGGVRVIYYYIARRGRVYLIDVFAKNVREALTKAEKNAVRALARHFEEES
jgi:hypothetical protein